MLVCLFDQFKLTAVQFPPTAMYTTAPPPCVDVLNNCHEYQADSCVGDFEGWAKDNCRKYCGYCGMLYNSL